MQLAPGTKEYGDTAYQETKNFETLERRWNERIRKSTQRNWTESKAHSSWQIFKIMPQVMFITPELMAHLEFYPTRTPTH